MGLANAVSRLKDSKAKSRVIILLTDGSNNYGDISPLTAAEIAKSMGIRVYTIGVGTNGTSAPNYRGWHHAVVAFAQRDRRGDASQTLPTPPTATTTVPPMHRS